MKLKFKVMNISKLKVLRILNLIAIGIPVIIALCGFIKIDYLMTALVSTMITGAIQVIVAILYLIFSPRSKSIWIYFFGLFLFVFLVFINLSDHSFWLPVLLLFYLTYIIHFKKHNA
mgnify:CR=1 FL=1